MSFAVNYMRHYKALCHIQTIIMLRVLLPWRQNNLCNMKGAQPRSSLPITHALAVKTDIEANVRTENQNTDHDFFN